MERQAWLRERGAWAEHWYTANAPTLDEQFPPITPTHLSFVTRVIDSVPVGGAVLDAPCGTGRYLDATLAAGRNVMGIDLSAGMLAQARAKHPEVALERIRLQDLGFEAAFDAAICVDAMEYVPPEDWPTVRPPAGPSRRWTRGARRLASTPVAQCTAVHGRPAGAMQGAAPGQGATGGHGGAPSQPAPGAD